MRFEALTVVEVKIMVLWVLIFVGGWTQVGQRVNEWGGVEWDRCVSGVQTFPRNTVPSPSRVKQSLGNGPTGYFSWPAWPLKMVALHTLPMTLCHIPEGLNPQLHCHEDLQTCTVQRHLWVHTKRIINIFTMTTGTVTKRTWFKMYESTQMCNTWTWPIKQDVERGGSWRLQHIENWKTFCWTLFSKWVLIKCPLIDTYHVTKPD